jgi:hypothetical protein
MFFSRRFFDDLSINQLKQAIHMFGQCDERLEILYSLARLNDHCRFSHYYILKDFIITPVGR